MNRPPERFRWVGEALAVHCVRDTDERIGQLILNAIRINGYDERDLFNIEDNMLARMIRAYPAPLNGS